MPSDSGAAAALRVSAELVDAGEYTLALATDRVLPTVGDAAVGVVADAADATTAAAAGGAAGVDRLVAARERSCVMHHGRLQVMAGALDAERCIASGKGLERVTLGQRATFTITPRDGRGCTRRMARGAPFRVCVLNGSGRYAIESSVHTRPDGTYQVEYTPLGPPPVGPLASELLLQVTFAGKPIYGAPFRVAVDAAVNAAVSAAVDAAGGVRSGGGGSRPARPTTAPAWSGGARGRERASRTNAPRGANGQELSMAVLVEARRGAKPSNHEALLARLTQMRAPQQRHSHSHSKQMEPSRHHQAHGMPPQQLPLHARPRSAVGVTLATMKQ